MNRYGGPGYEKYCGRAAHRLRGGSVRERQDGVAGRLQPDLRYRGLHLGGQSGAESAVRGAAGHLRRLAATWAEPGRWRARSGAHGPDGYGESESSPRRDLRNGTRPLHAVFGSVGAVCATAVAARPDAGTRRDGLDGNAPVRQRQRQSAVPGAVPLPVAPLPVRAVYFPSRVRGLRRGLDILRRASSSWRAR